MNNQKNKNQRNKILRYLETHKKGITPVEALNKFGCFRLGARIWELRAMGHNIETEYDCYVNDDGNNVRYGRYVLR